MDTNRKKLHSYFCSYKQDPSPAIKKKLYSHAAFKLHKKKCCMLFPLVSMQMSDTRSPTVSKTAALKGGGREDLELLVEATVWSDAASS